MSNQQLQVIRDQVSAAMPTISKVLPKSIKPEFFEQVVNTALVRDPSLVNADIQSFLMATKQCAQYGLVPDGREAFLNVFNTKVNGNFVKKVQCIVMVDGALKRARMSGEIVTIGAKAVFEGDEFDYGFGVDGEYLVYKPKFESNEFKLVFAYAKLKSGEWIYEVMPKHEVERVRSSSKSANSDYSPWSKWFDRMACKSAIHRLVRRLPNASEVMEMLEREEMDFNKRFDGARDVTPQESSVTESALQQKVDQTHVDNQQFAQQQFDQQQSGYQGEQNTNQVFEGNATESSPENMFNDDFTV